MTAPAVSVIMLCYNRAHFMRQAMESVLSQTFGDFEFIVMDHGSKTPEPFNIASEYAAKDSRMRVFRVEENRGVSAGRNRVLAEAHGEFVATIEDDDWWALDKLEKQTALLRENPEVGAVYTSHHYVNNDGERIKTYILGGKTHPPTSAPPDKSFHEFFTGSGQLFRRTALNAVGGWRPWFVQADDTDLGYRLQEKFSLHASALPLLYYRLHEGNLSYDKLGNFYSLAALFSARCRRAGQLDIIDASPSLESVLEHAVAAGFMPPKKVRKLAKKLLIAKMYPALRRIIAADKTAGGRERARLFFKLSVWSLIHNRLGFWLCQKQSAQRCAFHYGEQNNERPR